MSKTHQRCPIIIQNHRGAGDAAAENTLKAFEFSWKLGMVPEADVRTTRDGVFVPFHDDNFARVVPGADPELAAKGVADLTWEELSRLDVGAGQFPRCHVPRLADVFERMRGRPERQLYMDIKSVELQPLLTLVRQHNVDSQVVFATSDDALIRQWSRLAPSSQTLLWMGGEESALRARLDRLRAGKFAGITQLQTHIFLRPAADGGSQARLTPGPAFVAELAAELEQRGILYQVFPWQISAPEVYEQLLKLGAKSIATDFPEVALEAARRYHGTPA